LVVTHEGTSQVKRAKIDLLRFQYENFCINNSESIDDMITRFAKITNDLVFLGDSIDNNQKVRKIIHALSPTWEVKSTTLKELNDIIGNHKTHEIERKAREEIKTAKEENTYVQVYSTYLRRR